MKKNYKVFSLTAIILIISIIFSMFGYADSVRVGDPNNDGKISSADARIALRVALKIDTPDDDTYISCDANGDKKVTSSDARLILLVALKIYNESYFVTSSTKLSTLPDTTKITETPTTRNIQWDDIIGNETTVRPVTRTTIPITTIHPNNYYTTSAAVVTAEPSGNNPSEKPSGETPGTVPGESQHPTGSTVIHTGTPSRPNTEKTSYNEDDTSVPITLPPVTQNPNLPAFRLDVKKFSGKTVTAGIYVKNVSGLKNGMVSLGYDPDVLTFVSAAPINTLGSVNIRPDSELGYIGCEFSLTKASDKSEFCLGTVTFNISSSNTASTVLRVSVKNDSAYNWTDSNKRPLAVRPSEYSYFLVLTD